MLSPQMFDPALISFFKQAGEAFQQTAQAEAEGRMSKALQKHCGSSVPPMPGNPAFTGRCLLYAAKGYAMAHIDGAVSWGGIKAIMEASPHWPPPAGTKPEGALFLSFVLGFLYGSELPDKRQDAIEGLIPMAARVASAPEDFARNLGIDPENLKQMAESAGKGGLSSLMGLFGGRKP